MMYKVKCVYAYDEDDEEQKIEKLVEADSHGQAEERFIKWLDKYYPKMVPYTYDSVLVYEPNGDGTYGRNEPTSTQ